VSVIAFGIRQNETNPEADSINLTGLIIACEINTANRLFDISAAFVSL
jgi:hypothetical protein